MNEKPVSKSSQGSPKMQQIERYGVIALVFLLVTIVAVSFWGDSKSPGFWSRLTGKNDVKKETVEVASTTTNPLVVDGIADPSLPITQPLTTPTPIEGAPLVDGNTPSVADMPSAGSGTIGGLPANSFAPQTGAAPVVQPIQPALVQPVVPQTGGMVAYTIQRGDSLALIAKRQLGQESRWVEIQAANPGLDPKRLKLGASIQLPAGAAPQAAQSVAAAKSTTKNAAKKPSPKNEVAKSASRSYTIKKGDLLRSIARVQLGDEGRWKEIQSLNPGLDPTKLVVGASIKLPTPKSDRATPASSKPASTGTVLASADNKPRVK